MPFSQETFDLIVCRAAFKNFSRQSDAIDEIYRVLKPGGNAIIIDLETDEAPQWKAVLPCSLNRRPGAVHMPRHDPAPLPGDGFTCAPSIDARRGDSEN